ncbi:MAG: hypothetical protein WBK67_02445 [Minisyncoccales bacterium]
MAKVHFAPYSAIKYVGSKAKDFNTSLARPKPTLKKGDIVIVEKKDAFNLVSKGYGEFVMVDEIAFLKADIENADALKELEDEVLRLTEENAKLNAELLVALASLAEENTISEDAELEAELEEAFGTVPEVAPETLLVNEDETK